MGPARGTLFRSPFVASTRGPARPQRSQASACRARDGLIPWAWTTGDAMGRRSSARLHGRCPGPVVARWPRGGRGTRRGGTACRRLAGPSRSTASACADLLAQAPRKAKDLVNTCPLQHHDVRVDVPLSRREVGAAERSHPVRHGRLVGHRARLLGRGRCSARRDPDRAAWARSTAPFTPCRRRSAWATVHRPGDGRGGGWARRRLPQPGRAPSFTPASSKPPDPAQERRIRHRELTRSPRPPAARRPWSTGPLSAPTRPGLLAREGDQRCWRPRRTRSGRTRTGPSICPTRRGLAADALHPTLAHRPAQTVHCPSGPPARMRGCQDARTALLEALLPSAPIRPSNTPTTASTASRPDLLAPAPRPRLQRQTEDALRGARPQERSLTGSATPPRSLTLGVPGPRALSPLAPPLLKPPADPQPRGRAGRVRATGAAAPVRASRHRLRPGPAEVARHASPASPHSWTRCPTARRPLRRTWHSHPSSLAGPSTPAAPARNHPRPAHGTGTIRTPSALTDLVKRHRATRTGIRLTTPSASPAGSDTGLLTEIAAHPRLDRCGCGRSHHTC